MAGSPLCLAAKPQPASIRRGFTDAQPDGKSRSVSRTAYAARRLYHSHNPWDAGTAKLLAAMGFEALATTSLGLANTLGSAAVSRDAIIENCRMIAGAT